LLSRRRLVEAEIDPRIELDLLADRVSERRAVGVDRRRCLIGSGARSVSAAKSGEDAQRLVISAKPAQFVAVARCITQAVLCDFATSLYNGTAAMKTHAAIHLG